MSKSIVSLFLLTLTSTAAGQVTSQAQNVCARTVADTASPGDCVIASSIPLPGALLPLGQFFFVSPVGDVGLGTTAPTARLDVVGDVRADGYVAIGNDAVLGGDAIFRRLFDFSHTISDFLGAPIWEPYHSEIYLDPPIDLTGPDATYIYGETLSLRVEDANDRDIQFMYGPSTWVLPRGTGTVDTVLGHLAVAENDQGHTNRQGGAFSISVVDHAATATDNFWHSIRGGHYGPSGSIDNDYGLFVHTPYTDSPLTNHYGIYLEDQEFGLNDSYSIYSEGGTNYLGGELGIGTPNPSVALDVVGDIAATGVKNFVQPHPEDASLEIRFVCLEGNEAGTYFRGKGELSNGRAEIAVPEEFRLVTEDVGLTVQVTARGPSLLWVEEDGLERIVVRGTEDVAFDFFVNGVRRGYADFQSIRPRPENADRPAGRQGPSPDFPFEPPAADATARPVGR